MSMDMWILCYYQQPILRTTRPNIHICASSSAGSWRRAMASMFKAMLSRCVEGKTNVNVVTATEARCQRNSAEPNPYDNKKEEEG